MKCLYIKQDLIRNCSVLNRFIPCLYVSKSLNFGSEKKYLGQKVMLGLENNFGSKKIWGKKIWGLQNFVSEKSFGPKKCLV